MKNFLYFYSILFLFPSILFSQEDVIYLINPSFEGEPTEGSLNGPMIEGWYDCGFPGETIPDVHPKKNSPFGVTTEPADGESYLGFVVRDNETWEKISQRLEPPLKGGIEYEFSISLARSLTYESQSKKSSQIVNFATPSKLRIWGGNSICDRGELLAESSLVINSRWLKTKFTFNPAREYHYLILEAFYKTPSPFPYNGNILIDDASPIVPKGTFTLDSSLIAKKDSISKSHNKKYDKYGNEIITDGIDILPDSHLSLFNFSEAHMGTEFKIALYLENDSIAAKIAKKAFDRVAALEQIFSDYRENSEVSQLSATAGTDKKTRVSNDLWNVLVFARQVTDQSKGTYDFTAGALTKIWRKSFRQKEMPNEVEIKAALETVGLKKVILHDRQSVEIWNEDTRIDLGGVAKGYAVDEALKILKNNGAKRALVDGGGDITVGDPPPGKHVWTIKRTVYGKNGELTTEPIDLVNQGIATSGHTEKYLAHEGQHYSHIIDPRTGYGVTKKGIVSVVAPTCAEADAWATALSVEVITDVYLKLKKKGLIAYFSE